MADILRVGCEIYKHICQAPRFNWNFPYFLATGMELEHSDFVGGKENNNSNYLFFSQITQTTK